MAPRSPDPAFAQPKNELSGAGGTVRKNVSTETKDPACAEDKSWGTQVLEGTTRCGASTKAEVSVMAWTCMHDEAMVEGGKVQKLLRTLAPQVAVVEHGPRGWLVADGRPKALIDAVMAASFNSREHTRVCSVRKWARKDGYPFTWMVGTGKENN